MNQIIIALHEEDRARIDRVAVALENLLINKVGAAISNAPTEKPVTLEEVQTKAVELSDAGLNAKVREIIHAYARKLPDVPEDKLPEVWAKLLELESGGTAHE